MHEFKFFDNLKKFIFIYLLIILLYLLKIIHQKGKEFIEKNLTKSFCAKTIILNDVMFD